MYRVLNWGPKMRRADFSPCYTLFIMKKEFSNDEKVDILKAPLIWVSFKDSILYLPSLAVTTKIFWNASSSDLLKPCLWELSPDVVSSDRGGLPVVPGRVTLGPVGLPPLTVDRRVKLSSFSC